MANNFIVGGDLDDDSEVPKKVCYYSIGAVQPLPLHRASGFWADILRAQWGEPIEGRVPLPDADIEF